MTTARRMPPMMTPAVIPAAIRISFFRGGDGDSEASGSPGNRAVAGREAGLAEGAFSPPLEGGLGLTGSPQAGHSTVPWAPTWASLTKKECPQEQLRSTRAMSDPPVFPDPGIIPFP